MYVLVNFSVTVPNDFLSLSAKAMAELKHNDRSNVLYNLAKCMETLRRDGGNSRIPNETHAHGSSGTYC